MGVARKIFLFPGNFVILDVDGKRDNNGIKGEAVKDEVGDGEFLL